MRLTVSAALWLAAGAVHAAGWTFTDRAVVAGGGPGVFHHLDAGGRKSIAASGESVAIVWEDNRSGQPQVYAAFRRLPAGFTEELRLSSGKQAYEPAVAALGKDLFLFAWEQDGHVWLRASGASRFGAPMMTRIAGFSQASLAVHGDQAMLVFVRQSGKFTQVMSAAVIVGGNLELAIKDVRPVDPAPPTDDQLYPSVVATQSGITVAWEDRRRGHTVIHYSHAPHGRPYSAPRLLNELVQKSDRYGRGSGVTRVALADLGGEKVAATWMDKRGFLTGYDIYAAISHDGGREFGANEVVQDEFGNEIAQWHPAVAAGADGRIIIAWDDNRDDTSDIWLAWRVDGKWSTNVSPPATSGAAQQTHPSVAIDAHGSVHLVWVERDSDTGPTRVVYSQGQP